MRFRPCIDIHNGKVKQIVGGSLRDGSGALTNFVSEQDAGFYGGLYREKHLPGGHIILLNPAGSTEYEEDLAQARLAMGAFPGGFMIGGGVNPENAPGLLRAGASHVIVTSFVFRGGEVNFENLDSLEQAVGRKHLVLDLSCRKKDGRYYIVTDRWQKFTDVEMNHVTLDRLRDYADEYLIHAVDAEGKRQGVDEDLLEMLGSWEDGIPVTYAGGVSSFEDLRKIREIGRGRVDVTIGSALSLFGGDMNFEEVLRYIAGSEN